MLSKEKQNKPRFRFLEGNKRGASVVEAAIYSAIFALIFIVIISLFLSHSRLFDIETSRKDVVYQNIKALNKISQELRYAKNILSSQTINGALYTSSSNTLVVRLLSIDANQNILSGCYDYIAFYFDAVNSKLYSDTQPDSQSSRLAGKNLVGEFVQKIFFRYNSDNLAQANLAEIYLSTEKESRGQKQIFTNSTAIYLRNK